MKGERDHIQIDENLTYSLANETFNKPLKMTNHSDHTYVFKIKTNQKTVVSMQSTHDFIKPHTTVHINMKLADRPSQKQALKLEINYAIPSEEDLKQQDSRMATIPKELLIKRVLTINRDDEQPGVAYSSTPGKQTSKMELSVDKDTTQREVERSIGASFATVKLETSEIARDEQPVLQAQPEIPKTQSKPLFQPTVSQQYEVEPEEPAPPKPQQVAPKQQTPVKPQASPVVSQPEPKQQAKPSQPSAQISHSAFKSVTGSSFSPKKEEPALSRKPSEDRQKLEDEVASLNLKLDEQRASIAQLQRSGAGQVTDLVYPAPVILGLAVLSLVVGGAFSILLLN